MGKSGSGKSDLFSTLLHEKMEESIRLLLVMAVITVLCLRFPDNAARAIEAGAGDRAIQAMQKFTSA